MKGYGSEMIKLALGLILVGIALQWVLNILNTQGQILLVIAGVVAAYIIIKRIYDRFSGGGGGLLR